MYYAKLLKLTDMLGMSTLEFLKVVIARCGFHLHWIIFVMGSFQPHEMD